MTGSRHSEFGSESVFPDIIIINYFSKTSSPYFKIKHKIKNHTKVWLKLILRERDDIINKNKIFFMQSFCDTPH